MNKIRLLITGFICLSTPILYGMDSSFSNSNKPYFASSFHSTAHINTVPRYTFTVTPVIDPMYNHSQSSHTSSSIPIRVQVDHFLTSCRELQASGDIKGLVVKKQILIELKKKAWFSSNKQIYQNKINAIDAMLNAPITQKLKTIREGNLEEAEKAFNAIKSHWAYCTRLITSISESQQIQEYINSVGFNEAHAAEHILFSRTDYQQKQAMIRQEQNIAKSPSVSSSNTSTVSPLTQSEMVVQTTDMTTTCVTQSITCSDIDMTLRELQLQYPDFDEHHLKTTSETLHAMHTQHLLTPAAGVVSDTLKHGFTHYLKSLIPTNPLTHPKEFTINLIKYTALGAIHTATGGVLIPVQIAAQLASTVHHLQSVDTSQMTPNQYAEFIAEELADITYTIATTKLINAVKNTPIPEGFIRVTRDVIKGEFKQAVTPEGLVVDAKSASSSSSALEKSSNSRTGENSNNIPSKVILKVDNMEQFFETPFGKEIKDSVRKTRGNKPVYVVTEKIRKSDYVLKNGDQIYLDLLHKDHLEVFTGNNDFKMVLNLDGTKNIDKTIKGFGRRL